MTDLTDLTDLTDQWPMTNGQMANLYR